MIAWVAQTVWTSSICLKIPSSFLCPTMAIPPNATIYGWTITRADYPWEPSMEPTVGEETRRKWKGNKFTYFEGGLRVPAIISWPKKIPKNVTRDQVITAMDWLPTVCSFTGATLPDGLKLDGHDLTEIIHSKNKQSKYEAVHWLRKQLGSPAREWKLIGHKDKIKTLGNLRGPNPETKNYLNENTGQPIICPSPKLGKEVLGE